VIKVASTYFTYWAGNELLSKWTGVTSFKEALLEIQALIDFVKMVIFFKTFLFISIHCPDTAIEHLDHNN
jgi:hypothetical protein